MAKDLKTRKQEVVRDAIYYAALDLFTRDGYNETRIDQIVEAAGISQRSFFRYFATKDELLGYSSIKRGDVLVAAVEGCPPDLPPLEVIRHAAGAASEFAMSQPQTRQVIEITAANLSARQAHRGGMVEVEDRLSEAYARRTKNPSKFNLEPRLLALMTIMIADLTMAAWFTGEAKDCSTAARNIFAKLNRLYCPSSSASGSPASLAKAGQRKHSARQLVGR